MSKNHADLIARANHFVGLIGYDRIDQEFARRMVCDLRNALVEANAKIARVTAWRERPYDPRIAGGIDEATYSAVTDTLRVIMADEAAHQPLGGSNKGLADSATSLAARGSNEAAPDTEADRCDNPLRSEITCAMLVRDNDNLRKRVVELEAQQSSLREKVKALRDEAEKNPLAQAGSFLHGQETAFGIVLALLSDTETP